MDRERREFCRCKRAAVKNSFDVTRTRPHRTERRAIDLLKFQRRFFTQQILDRSVKVRYRERGSDGAADWKRSNTKRKSAGPRRPGDVVELLLQNGVGAIRVDPHLERDLSF